MFRLFAPMVLAVLLFPHLSFAQKASTIAGNVYYGSEYHPASNINISLYDGNLQFLETQATSDVGQFRFGGLRRTTYTLRIDVDGYEPVSMEVDVSMASDKTLAIYLKSTSKPQQQQESTHSSTVSVHELSMPQKARDYMEAGKKKLYDDKNPQGAVSEFEQAVAAAPGYYEADYQLAMAQLTLGNRSEAAVAFRQSIEKSKDQYAEADVGLGAVLLDQGEVSEADKSIHRGLQLNPNLWLGHYELGRALLKENRLPEAQASAEEARLLAPSAPIVYRLLSNIHLRQKDYKALLEDLDTYLTLDSNSPAGVRAKELRDQIQAKVGAQSPQQQRVTPASTSP
jgi:tetratricopeptide (TPR) repeat protein